MPEAKAKVCECSYGAAALHFLVSLLTFLIVSRQFAYSLFILRIQFFSPKRISLCLDLLRFEPIRGSFSSLTGASSPPIFSSSAPFRLSNTLFPLSFSVVVQQENRYFFCFLGPWLSPSPPYGKEGGICPALSSENVVTTTFLASIRLLSSHFTSSLLLFNSHISFFLLFVWFYCRKVILSIF